MEQRTLVDVDWETSGFWEGMVMGRVKLSFRLMPVNQFFCDHLGPGAEPSSWASGPKAILFAAPSVFNLEDEIPEDGTRDRSTAYLWMEQTISHKIYLPGLRRSVIAQVIPPKDSSLHHCLRCFLKKATLGKDGPNDTTIDC